MKESSHALLALINDILDFSKIEAGKVDLDPTDFNLHDAVAAMLRTVALRVARKGGRAGLRHRRERAGASGRATAAASPRSSSTSSATR